MKVVTFDKVVSIGADTPYRGAPAFVFFLVPVVQICRTTAVLQAVLVQDYYCSCTGGGGQWQWRNELSTDATSKRLKTEN